MGDKRANECTNAHMHESRRLQFTPLNIVESKDDSICESMEGRKLTPIVHGLRGSMISKYLTNE